MLFAQPIWSCRRLTLTIAAAATGKVLFKAFHTMATNGGFPAMAHGP